MHLATLDIILPSVADVGLRRKNVLPASDILRFLDDSYRFKKHAVILQHSIAKIDHHILHCKMKTNYIPSNNENFNINIRVLFLCNADFRQKIKKERKISWECVVHL